MRELTFEQRVLEALRRIEGRLDEIEATQADQEARLRRQERITYISPEDAKELLASLGLDPATTEGNPLPMYRKP